MLEKEVVFSIIIGCLVVALLFILLLVFLVYYSRNKNRFIREKIALQNKYQLELTRAEMEIQEETLRQLGYELHDNIGQLITLAKIQTQALYKSHPDPKLYQTQEVISKALEEVRRLSKTLDSEALSRFSLLELLRRDQIRINQMEVVQFELTATGEGPDPAHQVKIILYRVIQEMITNAMKHAQCSQIKVQLDWSMPELIVTVGDNGRGFVPQGQSTGDATGVGLSHIRNRIGMINGHIQLTSSPETGTQYVIRCPLV